MQASSYADVDASSPTRCVSLSSIPRPAFDELVAVAMVRSIAVKHLPRSRKMPTYLSELRAESRTARSVGRLHTRLELSSHLRLSVSALWDIQNTSYVLPPI